MSSELDSASSGSALLFALALTFVFLGFAAKKGFFRLPPASKSSWPTFKQAAGSFFVYFLVSILLTPILYLAVGVILKGRMIADLKEFPEATRGWLQWGILITLFFALWLYLKQIKKEAAHWIVWGRQSPRLKIAIKDMGMGGLTWIISYPAVLFTHLLIALFAQAVWGKSGVEQVAVKQLLELKEHPLLFGAMVFEVIVIVPFIEELLFRGFLQSWLRRKIGRWWALFSTALIFAVVHFSPSQGLGNVELIVALLPLSLFLGFIYERQGTLWAPYGLHLTFNGISALALVFQH